MIGGTDDRASGPPQVSAVDESDAAGTVGCLVRSFWDYPETRHLLPDARARQKVLPRYLGSDASDSARYGTLRAATVDGAVVGAAASLPPGLYPIGLRRQVAEARRLIPVAPWGVGAARRGRRGQDANRSVHRSVPAHHWLRVLGVEPARHGRGIGSLLLRALLDDADADGCGSFLFTATEANTGWYEAFGFVVLSAYHPTPTWPRVWAMWRDPPAGTPASPSPGSPSGPSPV